MESDVLLSCSSWPDVVPFSASSDEMAWSMAASASALPVVPSGIAASTLPRTSDSVARMVWNVFSFMAPACEMAPSSWPWAQPMSPVRLPMS